MNAQAECKVKARFLALLRRRRLWRYCLNERISSAVGAFVKTRFLTDFVAKVDNPVYWPKLAELYSLKNANVYKCLKMSIIQNKGRASFFETLPIKTKIIKPV